jgi:hypothetical protein
MGNLGGFYCHQAESQQMLIEAGQEILLSIERRHLYGVMIIILLPSPLTV